MYPKAIQISEQLLPASPEKTAGRKMVEILQREGVK
jgi:hypothetical protein